MAHTWPGMEKLSWVKVIWLDKKGRLSGCFKLYPDGTEAMIEPGYTWKEILEHHRNGGEFGEEVQKC